MAQEESHQGCPQQMYGVKNCGHPHNGISFSGEEQWAIKLCNNMEELKNAYAWMNRMI